MFFIHQEQSGQITHLSLSAHYAPNLCEWYGCSFFISSDMKNRLFKSFVVRCFSLEEEFKNNRITSSLFSYQTYFSCETIKIMK